MVNQEDKAGTRASLVVKVDKHTELEGSLSTTSSSPTTPRMMSKSNEASEKLMKDAAMQASTREPALDTINPSSSKPAAGRSSGRNIPPFQGSQQGPLSINTKEMQEGPPIPGTISGPSQSQASSGRPRRHRRIQSDDVPKVGPPPPQQGQYFYPSPGFQHPQYPQVPHAPQAGSYSPRMGSVQPHPMHRDHVSNGPPLTLTRARANTGPEQNPGISQYAMPSSPQSHSHRKSPSSGMPKSPSSGMPQGRQRPARGSRSHRKSVSWSAAHGQAGYGAFWNGEEGDAAESQTERHLQSQSFSPRGELMSLTASFRDPSEMSPRPSPRSQYVKGAPTTPTQDMHFSWTPVTPLNQPSPYSVGLGGEPIMTHRRTKSESSRKMQMRQHSAQIFMEEVKGVEQPASCRDVIFLLLFVFHLIFLVYLGQVYGKDALKDHGPNAAADTTVRIYYKNLVYIACLSGGFAIVVSSMLLAVMTFFARHFVQVALIFVITLSFIWGTLGIGLSPKNIVPITGIIALALSVAYTFIVWDRIPFAAANLLTALNGVYAFPGTVVVAFIFQALALGWSIYYAIVLVGLYDAIDEGKLQLSHRMQITMYVLMGVSYYWTFQVFAVSYSCRPN
jgi:hypothetical protein